MKIDWVALTRFRSYEDLEWEPDPGVNLLIGPNGAGKTNLLEAISYLSNLKSLRSVPDSGLIQDEADTAVVRAGVSDGDRERLIEIELHRNGPRRAQVDKSKLKRTSDLLGVLRVVAFLPEDLDVVKRGPSLRRDLIDDVAVQLWPAAHLDQTEMDRALRQRNAFLRAGVRDPSTLAVWDSRVAQAGGRVLARRWKVLETLNPYLGQAYNEISNAEEHTTLTYAPSWSEAFVEQSAAGYSDDLTAALEASHAIDSERRVTTVGPHRDEPAFEIDGHDARIHGSQGEQRTVSLAARLATHRAISDTLDSKPVLLLDDVFSELDPDRSASLAAKLPKDTQTLITSARPEDVPISGIIWNVGEGLSR